MGMRRDKEQRVYGTRATEAAQQLGALLAEDLGSVPRSYMITHNFLLCQLKPSFNSTGTMHAGDEHTYVEAKTLTCIVKLN